MVEEILSKDNLERKRFCSPSAINLGGLWREKSIDRFLLGCGSSL
jgi:hypothetical protein